MSITSTIRGTMATLACLLIGVAHAGAQQKTGAISGTIKDAQSKETLVGCTVWVNGSNAATTTDIDGNFTLEGVKAGKQLLKISYISYQKRDVNVNVEAGKTTRVEVDLAPETIEIAQAVVVGSRKAETDASVMMKMKESDVMTNGIGSQLITKTQDKDAAEVIKKIPGITITDGRFVIVRGLAERYNTVWLNGASAPSFESDSRAFSFDVIPSSMISNIEVCKTPAPENPADFAGAVIKITTKNEALTNSLKLSYGTGFIQGVTGKDFYSDKAGSMEWLGFDDGTKSLPDDFPTSEEMEDMANQSSDETAEDKAEEVARLKAITEQLSSGRSWTPLRSAASMPQSLSLSLTRSIKLGKASLGNITAINYGVTDNSTVTSRQFFNTEESTLDYQYQDTSYSTSVKAGIIHNWQLVLPGNNKIEFRNFLNQMGQSSFTQRSGTEYSNNNSIIKYQDFKYESRTIYNGQVAGSHSFNDGMTSINWLGGYSYTLKNTPDERRFLWELDTATGKYVFQVKPSADPFVGSRFYQQLEENVTNYALNLEQKINVTGDNSLWTLKTGAFHERKSRDFWLRNIGFVMNGTTSDIDMTSSIDSILTQANYYDYYYDTIIVPAKYRYYSNGTSRLLQEADTTLSKRYGILLKENYFPQDAYKSSSSLTAAYIGTKIPLGDFSIYGGARIEHYTQRIYDFYLDDLPQATKDSMDITTNTTDIFPSVNISYSITRNTALRFSYGKTINRPEIREVANFSYNNFEDKTYIIGNPDLKPAKIDNFDLRYEWFPSQTEIISLSLFYKHFTNPIEINFASNKGSGITLVPENTPSAQSKGIELDIRKSLASLEDSKTLWMLKNFTLVLNTSIINSKITTNQETARESSRPMQGQSPYIINAGTYFQSKKGTMISAMYNRIGKRIIFTGNNLTPHYWELPVNSVDLSFSQKFMKHFEFKLGVKNLLRGKRQVVMYDGELDEGNEIAVTSSSINRVFSAGVSCSF